VSKEILAAQAYGDAVLICTLSLSSLSLSLSRFPGVIAAWRDRDTWPNSTTKQCTTSPYEDPNPTLVPQKESLIYANNANTVAITGNGLIDGAALARQRVRDEPYSHGRHRAAELGFGFQTWC
jgi:hypothetical protein